MGVGGAQVMLLRYLKELGQAAADHRVLSLGRRGALAGACCDLNVRVDDLNVDRTLGSLLSAGELRRRVAEAAPDLIVGWMYHGCMAAQIATMGRRSAPPVIWSIHHSLDDIRNEKATTQIIIRSLASLSKRPAEIIYCSGVSKVQHEALGFAQARATVIPNGIDTNTFMPDRSRKAWLADQCGIPTDRFIIGNVARAHPMKDHESMVRATAALIERGRDCQTVIVGPGQAEGPAAALASELGIRNRITTFDSRDDIASVVAGFDVFLLSSAWGEAFPLVVGEAMSCGVPIVTTDVGDTALLVGDCGEVIAPKDPILLANAVDKILALSPEDRAAMGLRGRRRVTDLFSIAAHAERHAEAFERAVGPKNTLAA